MQTVEEFEKQEQLNINQQDWSKVSSLLSAVPVPADVHAILTEAIGDGENGFNIPITLPAATE